MVKLEEKFFIQSSTILLKGLTSNSNWKYEIHSNSVSNLKWIHRSSLGKFSETPISGPQLTKSILTKLFLTAWSTILLIRVLSKDECKLMNKCDLCTVPKLLVFYIGDIMSKTLGKQPYMVMAILRKLFLSCLCKLLWKRALHESDCR